jgi:8-oxo-dGTP pyrophosphatase MutT (NUDIX family)
MKHLPDIDLVAHLTARLQQPLPGATAHARFSPRPPRRDPFARDVPADARQAAALILLYPHGGPEGPPLRQPPLRQPPRRPPTYALPLTVRRADLPDHAGQISLPGGRIDAGETAVAAALREAEEEIGVDPATVQILGSLTPLYVMVSHFLVTPFVGVATERPRFQPAHREVAELLEVPVHQLQDRDLLRWGHRTREGYLIDFPYFDLSPRTDPAGHPGHHVWGATAMMLGEFLCLIDPDFAPGALVD